MIRAVAVTAFVLASAGCSEAPDGEPQTSSEAPTGNVGQGSSAVAEGPRIKGSGYAFNVPRGWGTPSQELPGFDPDSFAADLGDSDGFADNVNVLISPSGELTPRQAEVAARQELVAVGASDVRVGERVTVLGDASAHVSAGISMNGTDYTIEQFYLTDTGRPDVVTFSFSAALPAAERARVTGATLASWAWTQ